TDTTRARRDMELNGIMSRSPAREKWSAFGRITLRGTPQGVNGKSGRSAAKVLELTRFVGGEYVQDGMVTDHEPSTPGQAPQAGNDGRVPCPSCSTRVLWRGNLHRPFCSLACRLIDLGQWLDERYRIPSEDGTGDAPRDVS